MESRTMLLLKIEVRGVTVPVDLKTTRHDGTALKRHAIVAEAKHALERVLGRVVDPLVVPEGTSIWVNNTLHVTPCRGLTWRVARWVAEQVI